MRGEMTLDEVAERLGVSRDVVHGIEMAALAKLRRRRETARVRLFREAVAEFRRAADETRAAWTELIECQPDPSRLYREQEYED